MKTQILQLEPHDDFISTRDKMGWSQTSRVLLVFPPRRKVLTRRLDLVLLQRHSQALGVQLALVVSDSAIRLQARQLKISTFPSVRKALESRWKQPASRQSPRKLTSLEARRYLSSRQPARLSRELPATARLGFFSLGMLAVLSLAAALFPSAELHLKPAEQVQEIRFSAVASQTVNRVNGPGLIPISTRKVEVEGRDQVETTGRVQAPDRAAEGEVVFTNLTDHEVVIPAGTVVSAGRTGPRYATGREGRVAAGPGGSLTLPVVAVLPGRAGNQAAGRIQSILGPLSTDLTVTNPEPVQGGSERTTAAPSQPDRKKLHDRLFAALRDRARDEVKLGLLPGDLLFNPGLTLSRTLETVYSPPGSEPAHLLDLSLRLQFEARVISGEDLQTLATMVLDANLPEGFDPSPGQVEIALSEPPRLLPGSQARLELLARRVIQARLPQAQAANLALGLSPVQAIERLTEALPLGRPPQITLRPAWWPRLPAVPLRITVVVDQ